MFSSSDFQVSSEVALVRVYTISRKARAEKKQA